jgi:acyl-CoA thioesterase I
VPFFLAGIGERVELFQADRIHPTEQAQPMMLDNVWPALSKLVGAK